MPDLRCNIDCCLTDVVITSGGASGPGAWTAGVLGSVGVLDGGGDGRWGLLDTRISHQDHPGTGLAYPSQARIRPAAQGTLTTSATPAAATPARPCRP